jgi:hypothetical protein
MSSNGARPCWNIGGHPNTKHCLLWRCSWKLELGTSATPRSARNTQQCDNAVRLTKWSLRTYFWCLTNHRTKVKNSIFCLSFLVTTHDFFKRSTKTHLQLQPHLELVGCNLQQSSHLAGLAHQNEKVKFGHGFDMDSTFNKLQVESRVTKKNEILSYIFLFIHSMVCPSAFQVSHIWTFSYRFLFFSRKPCQETTMKRHPAN